ncbi:MAG: peptide-methionine (S)-S-oxide reductase MsrA [Thermoplasmatales archaeon]|jgi:methionine-S-sulfoxide reductase|nr:peptide-methionine (S)-S-oxide reductase MsrA [Thermoplasmatales archaeon]
MESIVLGGGCFWCTEAVFSEVRGVEKVESGYSGGTVPNPTYEEVCTGRTGHAEVVKVSFDPSEISLADILEIFFDVHDPTSLNRQGEDVGTQYRSAIFYYDDAQKETIDRVVQNVKNSGKYRRPIVTSVEKFKAFYPSEEYHHNYYNRNGSAPYCRAVISPKLQKFRHSYGAQLRLSQEK